VHIEAGDLGEVALVEALKKETTDVAKHLGFEN
jgi:hypothetical protein